MPILGIVAAGGGFTKFGDFYQIATSTATGGAVSSIDFNSIPQDYTHLQIRGIGITAVADRSIQIRFNSDTASNYSTHYLQGNGASAASGVILSTYMYAASFPNTTTYPGGFVCDILDYKDTNKYKTIRSIGGGDMNGAGGYAGLYSGNWRSTSAVTSITVLPSSGNFSQYSSFALYGIKAS